jgi:NADH-quinone oxidoreductase subunit J
VLTTILFYFYATVLVASALGVILARNPVRAALFLVLAFFTSAVLWLLLEAEFLGIVLVLVYVGAVMVLFLFVIMMLDLGHPEKGLSPHWKEWLPALLLIGISVASLALVIVSRHAAGTAPVVMPTIREVALRLFNEHGLAVELVSLQLLFALVGALYLGRQK